MERSSSRRFTSNSVLVGFATIAASISTWGVAFGQGAKPAAPAVAAAPAPVAPAFKSLQVAESFKSDKVVSEKVVREKKRIKDEMLRGGSFNEKEINEYYVGYLIPQMTSLETPEACNESRREVLEDIERAEKSDAILKPFNDWLLKILGRIASDNYHPAASINATLLIGRLNDIKASNSSAPKPMGIAIRNLMSLALAAKNDGVRAAALEGLERHIRLSQATWSEPQRQAVADALIKTLSEAQPRKRSNEAHGWLLGRSLELLTILKHKKTDEVYLYAVDRLADEKTNPLLLEKALLVVGSYKPVQTKPESAVKATTNSIKYLIAESKRWRDSLLVEDMSSGPAGYTGGMEEQTPNYVPDPSMEPGMAAPKKKEKPVNPFDSQAKDVKLKRRQMHQILETIRFGFDGVRYGAVEDAPATGIFPLLPDGQNKQVLGELIRAMESLQKSLNDTEIKKKQNLEMKTKPAFDTLVSAAEAFPGVLMDPDAVDEDAEADGKGEDKGDDVVAEPVAGAPAGNALVAPAVNQPLAGDGFGQ